MNVRKWMLPSVRKRFSIDVIINPALVLVLWFIDASEMAHYHLVLFLKINTTNCRHICQLRKLTIQWYPCRLNSQYIMRSTPKILRVYTPLVVCPFKYMSSQLLTRSNTKTALQSCSFLSSSDLLQNSRRSYDGSVARKFIKFVNLVARFCYCSNESYR